MSHRVVVTGIGLWTALGVGTEENLARLSAGDVGFAPSRLLDVEGLAGRLVAEIAVPEGTAAGAITRSELFCARTVADALAQAGIDPRTGSVPIELIASVSTGGMFETERELTRIWRGEERTVPHLAALAGHPISAPVDYADRVAGPFRSARTVCSACSGGAVAIGLGLSRVRSGAAEIVVAGGVDSVSRLTVAGFGSLQALDPEGCRPFSRSRRGLVLGEGAAFLVLEPEEGAKKRGASILGYVGGWAVRSEAHHITHPDPSGVTAAEVIRRALADAGVEPHALGYVSAHGTGTPLNDAMESRALALALGPHAAVVPLSSQKGQVGHTLAAAGAVEAAATLLALRAGVILPNVSDDAIDGDFGLAVCGPRGVPGVADVALSNSFGFGGTDASLVLSRTPLPVLPAENAPCALFLTGVRTLQAAGLSTAAEAKASLLEEDPVASGEARGEPRDLRSMVDAERARRFDGSSRAHAVLLDALLAEVPVAERGEVGLVAASAFGSTDLAATFSARVEDRGARFASPADFPNLVPSSPGANAAIYCGLRGPSLAVAELSVGIFAALEIAADLLRDHRADAMVALHTESESTIVEKALAPAVGTARPGGRRHGGAGFLLERGSATGRTVLPGRSPLAELVAVGVLRLAGPGSVLLPSPEGSQPEAPADDHTEGSAGSGSRSRVVMMVVDEELRALAASAGWGHAPVMYAGARFGTHEAAVAQALAGAVSLLAKGEVDRVLVLERVGARLGFAILGAA